MEASLLMLALKVHEHCGKEVTKLKEKPSKIKILQGGMCSIDPLK